MRWAPIRLTKPTSITFDDWMFMPTRNPPTKIVAPARSQIGHTDLPLAGRPRTPIHVHRANSQRSPG